MEDTVEPTEERQAELIALANERLLDIILSWWYEIGSWDDILDEGTLTIEELGWIWENRDVAGTSFAKGEIWDLEEEGDIDGDEAGEPESP